MLKTYKQILIENAYLKHRKFIKEQDENEGNKSLELEKHALLPLKIGMTEEEIRTAIEEQFPNSDEVVVKNDDNWKYIEFKNPVVIIILNSDKNKVVSIYVAALKEEDADEDTVTKKVPILWKGKNIHSYTFSDLIDSIKNTTNSPIHEKVWQKEEWMEDGEIINSISFLEAGILIEGNKDNDTLHSVSIFSDEDDISIE